MKKTASAVGLLVALVGCNGEECADFEPGTYLFDWTVRSGTCVPPADGLQVLSEPPSITVPAGCVLTGEAACGVTSVRLECPTAGGGAIIVEQDSTSDGAGRYTGTQLVTELMADGRRVCTSEFDFTISKQ